MSRISLIWLIAQNSSRQKNIEAIYVVFVEFNIEYETKHTTQQTPGLISSLGAYMKDEI